MKKSLLKDTVRQIKNTFKRFLSILRNDDGAVGWSSIHRIQ